MDFEPYHGRRRVVISGVRPEIDAGQFPIKRIVGEKVEVEAWVFSDGHDHVFAELLYRPQDQADWRTAPMEPGRNDVWTGVFRPDRLGPYVYTVRAWIDVFGTWQHDLVKKFEAGQDVSVDLQIGLNLIGEAAGRAPERDGQRLRLSADEVAEQTEQARAVEMATDERLHELMNRYPDPSKVRTYERQLPVTVDRERARFSSWYEFFPRSAAAEPGTPGTLADAEALLPQVAEMGFDVVYLPPIHPIGRTHRKGRNNARTASPDDPGSPWAIGGEEGGHKAIHPELGTLEDFRRFIQAANDLGMEVAMDIAFQCSPDHPYVKEHPDWFKWRPDGSVQYAENPPKKYEDILPIHFETETWRELWEELTGVVLFWAEKGVRAFRVDNPHTKPFAFWDYLIGRVKAKYPDAIFLAEAFTRPNVMYRLAKVGFTQSYTYFTWRNARNEIVEYMQDLTRTEVAEHFRPNFWPNTPDILPQVLQFSGRPAFMTRLVLAATLSSNYGIYGPVYEQMVSAAVAGREEYLDSEKYEIRHWDRRRAGTLVPLIERINRIRRENAALQQTRDLHFLEIDNPLLLAYAKADEDETNFVVVVVNLDLHHRQSGWVRIPLERWEMDPSQPFMAHDLLSDDRYIWQGEWNYVELDPQLTPAHLFVLRRRLRREMDFDYFM